jgi:transposase
VITIVGMSDEKARVESPDRRQLLMAPLDLERIIPEEHPARAVWAYVERLDLSAYYDEIEARGSEPGRPAKDPKLLLALWLYATSEAVGSARLLSRLCERDAPYQWLCGGVKVNHHTLSDFRVGHGKKLDRLLTQNLAALMKQGAVTLRRVTQDGLKVRAFAGAASFRRRQSLDRCFEEAKEQVRKLKRELEDDGSVSTRREQAARERAAAERQTLIEAALKEAPLIEEEREERAQKNGKKARAKEIRVSTTDPESRVMKMADGGYRPAWNVQLATDVDGGCIVGVEVTNHGTDQPNLVPMLDDIRERTGKTPQEYLVDGGYVNLENFEVVSERGATVYAPVPTPRSESIDRHAPKKGDGPAVAAWRVRMGTEEAKRIYRDRAATAERTNADLRRHRGLDLLNVRGSAKVTSVVLLAALTFNCLRMASQGWLT